jgi:hypothetical protein
MKYLPLGAANPELALRRIKLLHTAVWVLFAGSILLIPVAAGLQQWRLAFMLIGLVSLEALGLGPKSHEVSSHGRGCALHR